MSSLSLYSGVISGVRLSLMCIFVLQVLISSTLNRFKPSGNRRVRATVEQDPVASTWSSAANLIEMPFIRRPGRYILRILDRLHGEHDEEGWKPPAHTKWEIDRVVP